MEQELLKGVGESLGIEGDITAQKIIAILDAHKPIFDPVNKGEGYTEYKIIRVNPFIPIAFYFVQTNGQVLKIKGPEMDEWKTIGLVGGRRKKTRRNKSKKQSRKHRRRSH